MIGRGPVDLVFVPGFVSHLEYDWEHPLPARFFHRLSAFSRLIRFDKRGTGLSDRVVEMPTLEQRMDDVRAVMDAVGSQQAALFGVSEGGPMSVLFAATYPEREKWGRVHISDKCGPAPIYLRAAGRRDHAEHRFRRERTGAPRALCLYQFHRTTAGGRAPHRRVSPG